MNICKKKQMITAESENIGKIYFSRFNAGMGP